MIQFDYFQLNCFMIMMLDDYHNIHVKKVPQKLQTSTAVHMASSILDIHVGIPSVVRPVNIPLHRPVPVVIQGSTRVCHGGIAPDVVKNIMQDALISMEKTYMQQIHPKMQKIDPAKLIQSMREMR